ncbi:hypothetical protein [Bradyrhizobium sp. CCBAU 51753]|uniref:hypothetical protein n=1 Tax=Bradyrhizobium sp. CCBAU 51753 TaxID=1325100 RepID=UPI00188C9C7E|nr:hypothetical protein [Bradyrhizobium sp. CCBAU 51753]
MAHHCALWGGEAYEVKLDLCRRFVAVASVSVRAMAEPAEPFKSRFAGAYAAITGGYDFSDGQTHYTQYSMRNPADLAALDCPSEWWVW